MLSVVFTYYPRNINKKIFTYYPLRNCDVFVFLIAALAHFFLCDKNFDPLLFLFGEKSGKKVRVYNTGNFSFLNCCVDPLLFLFREIWQKSSCVLEIFVRT